MSADARDALRYYGDALSIRRPGMEMEAQVRRVNLIYEGGDLKPVDPGVWRTSVEQVETKTQGVEVSTQ